MTAVALRAALAVGVVNKSAWLSDSGCTTHMCNSSEGFVEVHAEDGVVTVGGLGELKIASRGTMKVWTLDSKGKRINITLEDVLLVPGLGFKLLSVDRIISKGARVIYGGGKSHIRFGRDVIIPLQPLGGLFQVELNPQSIENRNQAALVTLEEEKKWHARMGHRNHADLRKLAIMEVGVPNNLNPTWKCEVCELGKHTQRSFPKQRSERTTTPFEVVHTDLYGSVDQESLVGSRYAIVFTDEATRYKMPYFLNAKSEAPNAIRKFVADVSRMLGGTKVRRIHSDNAGEFISHEAMGFAAEKRFSITTSGKYAPQQNGMAERGWRTVNEMATCLLKGAGLGKEFWAEAMNHAVYLLNRSPTEVLDGETPYFKLFGKRADLSHLRIFGCLAFVQKTKIQQKEVETKAWKGVMVGIDNYNRTCYRIYNPETDKVTKEVHVTFHESVMYAKKEQSNEEEGEEGLQVRIRLGGVERDDTEPAGAPELPEPVGAPQEAEEVAEDLTGEVAEDLPGGEEPAAGAIGDELEHRVTGVSRSGRRVVAPNRLIAQDDDQAENHRANVIVHHALVVANEVSYEAGFEPKSYDEAMQSKEATLWKAGCDEEYGSLIKLGTWTLIEPPEGARVLNGTWVFKAKRDSSGKIVRYKARYVIKGFAQKAGLDYGETFAPVAKAKTILTVLAIAAIEDWELFNLDVETAFLNSPIDVEMYMEQPQGYEKKGPNGRRLVCKLKKSLYGLKQAPRNWNLMIDQWLVDYGFVRSTADPCMDVLNGDSGEILIVVLYVDDLMIAGNDLELIDQFKVAIAGKFTMKDLGELRWMLGMEIKRDRPNRVLEINQTVYIEQVLERFGMANCKPVDTPMVSNLTRDTEKKSFDFDYAKLVGSVLYLAVISRPDIAYAVQCLGRQMQATSKEHWAAAKRLLRYLQGTKHLGISFGGAGVKDAELVGYCDADWGNDRETRRSTTGYVFMLAGGSVSWNSRLQPTVALSSTEAEHMALSAGTQEAIFLRRLLKEVGYDPKGATTLREDNQGSIALSENPINHQRTKHIDIRYHFVREKVDSGEVTLTYIPTELCRSSYQAPQ